MRHSNDMEGVFMGNRKTNHLVSGMNAADSQGKGTGY
ncbi:hypothetical protein [Rossellomorea marisflavi]